MTIGRGCGKSGIRDKLRPMLASVVANVRTLSVVGTRARSTARFAFCFSNQSLKPEAGFRSGFGPAGFSVGFGLLSLNLNFNEVLPKALFYLTVLKFCREKGYGHWGKGRKQHYKQLCS